MYVVEPSREDRDGALVFHPLPAPTRADVTEVARRTAVRVERILRAGGRSTSPAMQADDPHPLSVDEPTLAAHYAAAAQGISVAGERAGKPTLRLVVSQDPSAKATAAGDDDPVAEVRGVKVGCNRERAATPRPRRGHRGDRDQRHL
jgi:hypothetical protein